MNDTINFSKIKQYTLIFKEQTYENGFLINEENPIKVSLQTLERETNPTSSLSYSKTKQMDLNLERLYNKLREELVFNKNYDK